MGFVTERRDHHSDFLKSADWTVHAVNLSKRSVPSIAHAGDRMLGRHAGAVLCGPEMKQRVALQAAMPSRVVPDRVDRVPLIKATTTTAPCVWCCRLRSRVLFLIPL